MMILLQYNGRPVVKARSTEVVAHGSGATSVRSAKSVPLTRLRLRTVRVNMAKARPAARRELPIRCRRELNVLAVWPIYIHRSQYCTSRQYQV